MALSEGHTRIYTLCTANCHVTVAIERCACDNGAAVHARGWARDPHGAPCGRKMGAPRVISIPRPQHALRAFSPRASRQVHARLAHLCKAWLGSGRGFSRGTCVELSCRTLSGTIAVAASRWLPGGAAAAVRDGSQRPRTCTTACTCAQVFAPLARSAPACKCLTRGRLSLHRAPRSVAWVCSDVCVWL